MVLGRNVAEDGLKRLEGLSQSCGVAVGSVGGDVTAGVEDWEGED